MSRSGRLICPIAGTHFASKTINFVLPPDNFHTAYHVVLQAVKDDTIPMDQIDASVLRIIKAKL